MALLERTAHLAKLTELIDGVGEAGRLVLISGEAGAGKTALVEAFIAEPFDCRVLVGRCDDLFAPRPLGPLADMARGAGGRLVARSRRATRPRRSTRFLRS